MTEEERVALLQQPNQRTATGLRNACLLTVMLDAGLRAAEVLHVHIHEIDWKRGKILVKQGKGKKDRVLWLHESAMEKLRQWKTTRKNQTALLFTTNQGRHINSSYLRVMVKRYAKKAKIFKDVHPHTLRHTFATDLYRTTKNIRLTQKALGHADLSTTMIYTHLVDDELEEALKSFRTS